MKAFHAAARGGRSKIAPDGTTLEARSFGIKLGYWPCFQAPYIELAWNTRRYAAWYGLAGYAQAREANVVSNDCGTDCIDREQ